MVNVFAVPVFFIVFRETLETGLVVSILLAFLKQQIGPEQDKKTYQRLRKQVSQLSDGPIAFFIVSSFFLPFFLW
jgi:high-affinity Fe2+/Pb2+ permease